MMVVECPREQIARHLGYPVKLEIDRVAFGSAVGVLITQVRSVKQMGSRHFVLVDAGFNDSIAWQCTVVTTISVPWQLMVVSGTPPTVEIVVAGPLCESGDVFTQQEGGNVENRASPEVKAVIIWYGMIQGHMAHHVIQYKPSAVTRSSV
ncbi:hypothetical protein ACNKHR_18955 [Shigella flexneri]